MWKKEKVNKLVISYNLFLLVLFHSSATSLPELLDLLPFSALTKCKKHGKLNLCNLRCTC